MAGDQSRIQENQNHSMQLSLSEWQYPLHQRQQDALAECDRLITHFEKYANRHKGGFQRLRFLGIGLAVTTTVLSALAVSNQFAEFRWVVPAVSGLATLSTTLLGQTSAQKIWMRSQDIQQKLQIEKFLYLQSAGDYVTILSEEDQVRYFSKRLMEIWSEASQTGEQSLAKRAAKRNIAPNTPNGGRWVGDRANS